MVGIFLGMVISGGETTAIMMCLARDSCNPISFIGYFFVGLIFSPLYGGSGYLDLLKRESLLVITVIGLVTGLSGGAVLLLMQRRFFEKFQKFSMKWVLLGTAGWGLGGLISIIPVLIPEIRDAPPLWENLFINMRPLNITVGLCFGLGAGFLTSIFQYYEEKDEDFSIFGMLAHSIGWGIGGVLVFSIQTALGFVLGAAVASMTSWMTVTRKIKMFSFLNNS